MTDPAWRTYLESIQQTEITVLNESGGLGDAYITISVGGLLQNAYFKLVAAVITPDEVSAAAQRVAQLPAE